MAGTGLLVLLALTVVMALASFLAGALPLSMSLSQSQLRLISSIGVGILVGTSLIVIIPEGIGAITETSAVPAHSQNTRNIHAPKSLLEVKWVDSRSLSSQGDLAWTNVPGRKGDGDDALHARSGAMIPEESSTSFAPYARNPTEDQGTASDVEPNPEGGHRHAQGGFELPTFYIGLSLILGFVLMFLIDRLPRHASENFQPPPAPRHISLSNLGGSSLAGGVEEREGFLGSLAPTPKQSRSLATTTGLVIHAAADGIAMGASATSPDTKLGFIIFIAIMVHKAPAAFGLTSILLKQGLSKRAARGHLIVFSLASPFGAWATFLLVSFLGGGSGGQLNQWWTGMLLLFSGGTFLYVAMHAMQEGDSPFGHDVGSLANGYDGNPRKHAHPQMRETLATMIGMFLPLLTQFGHHH
ncbi:Zinc/iron permease [Durotheca rogersii]|uniref:Zinc/iron permease n=1 Tax=Durotheca rogersii TaxID=419775 RepID=UPI00221E55AA|nr:Zinc/iron permease [Durotheca rogersii]KAI5862317.1 Zinc/iron permease [Durotheca rogersii]